MSAKLILKDKTEFEGKSFGAHRSVAGEVVFATGMVGYPESLTDPSYRGQILVLTYPLQGNYGVPARSYWESGKIQVSGLIVSDYINEPSHPQSEMTLSKWLKKENVPGLIIKDTRQITQRIREEGAILGKIVNGSDSDIDFDDPNFRNLVAEVSTRKLIRTGKGKRKIVLIDCGAKRNIASELAARDCQVITVPWDCDPFAKKIKFDGIVVSNGPGDPKMAGATTQNLKNAMDRNIPVLGICLGNQLLTLAAGGNTAKMKFGHRGQNQSATLIGTNRTYLTTQNHGFVVKKIPKGFTEWFRNANDRTNEGIRHKSKPWMSVQFHPEARPGPLDTAWIFDEYLKRIRK